MILTSPFYCDHQLYSILKTLLFLPSQQRLLLCHTALQSWILEPSDPQILPLILPCVFQISLQFYPLLHIFQALASRKLQGLLLQSTKGQVSGFSQFLPPINSRTRIISCLVLRKPHSGLGFRSRQKFYSP